jgi:hypothetical protein
MVSESNVLSHVDDGTQYLPQRQPAAHQNLPNAPPWGLHSGSRQRVDPAFSPPHPACQGRPLRAGAALRGAHVTSPADDELRTLAEDIERRRSGWMVVFGVYSRQFSAYPLFSVRRRVIVIARYPPALVGRIDEAERRYRIHPRTCTVAGRPGEQPAGRPGVRNHQGEDTR